jgi:hypothetical protein
MTRRAPTAAVLIALALIAFSRVPLSASGLLGIYGIIEKVVFEPNDTSPERVQLWGAFAYSDGVGESYAGMSKPQKGYMYFRLPDPASGPRAQQAVGTIRNEWTDLKSVAGKGQAVGFGRWNYFGLFSDLKTDVNYVGANRPPFVSEFFSPGGSITDMRVRPASEAPAGAAVYQTNIGVVKLNENGAHVNIVRALKDALK